MVLVMIQESASEVVMVFHQNWLQDDPLKTIGYSKQDLEAKIFELKLGKI